MKISPKRVWPLLRPVATTALVIFYLVSVLLWAHALAGRGKHPATQGLAAGANALAGTAGQWRGAGKVVAWPVTAAVEAGRLAWRLSGRLLRVNEVDWERLEEFRVDNTQIPPTAPGSPRVVLFGDSITAGWDLPRMFPGRDFVNRGIDGNTTVEMLARFRSDVLDLHPQVVVIAGGINDLAGRWTPIPTAITKANYASMAELARLHGIRVVFASLLPVGNSGGRLMGVRVSREDIADLNAWLRNYCVQQDLVYIDYHSRMADGQGWMQPALSADGLHPNDFGYTTMRPLAETAVENALVSQEAGVLVSGGPLARSTVQVSHLTKAIPRNTGPLAVVSHR